MAQRVTLKDVARAAGVAPATASHALTGTGTVSEQTAAHVRGIAARLGYRPNMIAANLRRRHTSTIGVLVPDLINPFYSELVEGIEAAARSRGYSLLGGTSDYEPMLERHYIDLFISRRCDGIVVIAGRERVDDIIHAGIPIVAINSHTTSECHPPMVEVRDRVGVHAGVTHLIGLGHRTIGLVTFTGVRLRDEGYRQALEDAGIPYNPNLVVATERANWEQAAEASQGLLRSFPTITALMVTADISALGAVRAAHLAGLRVPDDLAIVGFDDVSLARAVIPSLTTVAQPIGQIASSAMDMIVAQINDRNAPHTYPRVLPRVLLDAQLVIRESSGSGNGKSQDMPATPDESELAG